MRKVFSTMRSAEANPASAFPLRIFQLETILSGSWIIGAPGFIASSGSKTPGSASYSISISSMARSAMARVSAATSAIGSPTNRTPRVASTGASDSLRRSCPVWPGMSVISFPSGKSSAVNTQATPASARALFTFNCLICAEGSLLRKTLA